MRPSRADYSSNLLDCSYTDAVIFGINYGYINMSSCWTYVERNEDVYNGRVRSQQKISVAIKTKMLEKLKYLATQQLFLSVNPQIVKNLF